MIRLSPTALVVRRNGTLRLRLSAAGGMTRLRDGRFRVTWIRGKHRRVTTIRLPKAARRPILAVRAPRIAGRYRLTVTATAGRLTVRPASHIIRVR